MCTFFLLLQSVACSPFSVRYRAIEMTTVIIVQSYLKPKGAVMSRKSPFAGDRNSEEIGTNHGRNGALLFKSKKVLNQ